jgi:hypothetical protein
VYWARSFVPIEKKSTSGANVDARTAAGAALDGGLKGFQLVVGRVARGSGEFRLDAQDLSGFEESRLGFLPVGKRNIGGNEDVALVFLVLGLGAGRQQRERQENHSKQFPGGRPRHVSSFGCGLDCTF